MVEAVERVGVGPAGRRRLFATAGWATFDEDSTTVSELVERADAAMREAKRPNGQQTA